LCGKESMDHSSGHPPEAESLVREHWRAVFSLCLAHASSVPDAEDAAQDTFAKAIAGLNSLRDPAKARSWLFGIARRVCTDQVRRRRQFVPLVDLPRPAPPVGDSRLEKLQKALERLPVPYREAITLFYLDGQSTTDLAANLGLTPAAARQRLSRARLLLHERMTENQA
jgi:RNA polymerase sigma factor (sigma-70 family)